MSAVKISCGMMVSLQLFGRMLQMWGYWKPIAKAAFTYGVMKRYARFTREDIREVWRCWCCACASEWSCTHEERGCFVSTRVRRCGCGYVPMWV